MRAREEKRKERQATTGSDVHPSNTLREGNKEENRERTESGEERE